MISQWIFPWFSDFPMDLPMTFRRRRAFVAQVSQQRLLHAAAQEGLHVLCHELLTAAKQRGPTDQGDQRGATGELVMSKAMAKSGKWDNYRENHRNILKR